MIKVSNLLFTDQIKLGMLQTIGHPKCCFDFLSNYYENYLKIINLSFSSGNQMLNVKWE